ncbi:MAG: winged helix-turn-helix transcriptional regulator [Chromatiales bacterium]|nr:winged helix-turn-helix transcriptional regulator [Chromatiales bacterium]
MLGDLFTSKMRVNILIRLFLNPEARTYLRELAQDYGASPGHVHNELQQLSSAGLLRAERDGRQIVYRAEQRHPLFPELQSMVRKSLGMDRIVDSIVSRLGSLHAAYLVGDYANGRDTGIIDLVLVGDIDRHNLDDLVMKTERYIGRRIRTRVLTADEFTAMADGESLNPRLQVWIHTGAEL